MSKIDQLIEDLCPNGVESLKLDDIILSLKTGLNPRKNFRLNEIGADNYYVTIREIINGNIVFSSKTDKVTDEGLRLINNRSNLEVGDILFSGTGTIGRTAVVTEQPRNWNIKEGIYCIKPDQTKVSPKFLMHLINSPKIKQSYESKVVGGTVNSVPMGMLRQIIMPIPPLAVQKEIVNILDKFTQLEAELEAELEARRKQYEYYRNQLLTFSDEGGVRWTTLGEVAMYSKSRIASAELNQENYVGVDNLLQNRQGRTDSSHVPDAGNMTRFEDGDILIGNIRPYLKKIWHSDRVGGTNGDVLVIQLKDTYRDKLIPRYVYQLLASDKFFTFNMKNSKGAKMPRGDKASIMKFEIPVPSIEAQKRVVSILDKFDSLTHDISAGLPAEISARRKQYDYYRTKLLTFHEVAA